MDWDQLYSEVKRRKMTALNKLKEVKAVEKHGGLIVIDGVHEKAEEIFELIYAKKKRTSYW